MNRLQRKCLLASATTHSLLLSLFLFGAAFIPSKSKKESSEADPVVMFIPANAILNDSATYGGGNPKADPNKAPAPLPPPPPNVPPVLKPPTPRPAPTPAPETVKPAPEKVKDPPPEDSSDDRPNPLAVEKAPKPRKALNTTVVKRTNDSALRERQEEARREKQDRDRYEREVARYNTYRQSLRSALTGAADGISRGATSPTTVDVFGPGGQAYVRYKDFVKLVYEAAWNPPDEASEDSSIVTAQVTIARDGTVLNGSILTPSNNPLLDRTVQATLNKVRDIGHPFPAGSKDARRTFKIIFDLRAKKGLG